MRHATAPSFTPAWPFLLLVLCSQIVLYPALSSAQGYDLTVTLRDAAGQPIPAITINVCSAAGDELARQPTVADGSASFTGLPAVVLVAVVGQPRGGPALFQVENDATGVQVMLDRDLNPRLLDLRVERDGMVLPDPATMIDLQVGGPTVVGSGDYLPSLPLATPAPIPTARTGGATQVVVATGSERPAAGPAWVSLLTLLIIIVAIVILVVIQRRRANP